MTTGARPRIIPATARIDAEPRLPTKAQRLRQHRQLKAWKDNAARREQPNACGGQLPAVNNQ
jgi:hypothetical protein